MANSKEFKAMIGRRLKDSYGFTYAYGKTANEYKNANRSKTMIARCRRNDKRATKAKEMKAIFTTDF